MTIQFNTDKTINGDQRTTAYYTQLISEELSKFGSHITRIEVHVSDENGPKDGNNAIRCLMEVRLEGKQPTAVTNKANSLMLAVSGAIQKTKAILETSLERKGKHSE
ncbi:MAG: ribosomal subunit interface protein [Bacteroidetes bacterium RIFCSPHIGHO2_02_FULL_44_7]|nr:MAG: ribosomal subunit interface protein [Bacteroidetes bacterium RIFCSPHIGHO2_02_FULL_44_7]